MLSLSPHKRRKKISLTPMIDVVFLLLVFFMLSTKLNKDTAIQIGGAGHAGIYQGPPRLITIFAEQIKINGTPTTFMKLPSDLELLTRDKTDTIILQPQEGATVQKLADVLSSLNQAGFTNVVVVQ